MFTVVNGRITRLLDFFDTAALVEAYRPSAQGVSA
jgi:ketosteroid isomerase-like protein